MKKKIRVIGLMSGTSLDGLDIALCTFSFINNKWNYTIEHAETIPYPDDILKALKKALSQNEKKILDLDRKLGFFFAEYVNLFIIKYNIIPDIIASHGHTVFHQPEKACTLQIANGEIIAEHTGITTINDFRTYDVKLGGQGAPLVPIGDELLFHEYIACINLGGFSNISYKDSIGKRLAFDICPCNLILNEAASELSLSYDKNGEIARCGNINYDLLNDLNALEYYGKTGPKSLGLEWLKNQFSPIIKRYKISAEDLLATYNEHISLMVSREVNKLGKGKILITGGGAYNKYLTESITRKTYQNIIIPKKEIIEYKEALIFAFLGVLRYRNEINILSSVTGASKDHIAGTIHKKT